VEHASPEYQVGDLSIGFDQTTDLLLANPYPSAADLWRRTDSSFLGEEEFDDLYFRDFITVGRRVARRSQASLGGTPNQMAILTRGTDITMTEARDMSLGDSVQYTSMVGTMLAEAMAVDREEVSPKLSFDWLG